MPQATLSLTFIWVGEGQVPATIPANTVYVEESSVEEPPYKAWYQDGTSKALFTGPRPNRPPQ